LIWGLLVVVGEEAGVGGEAKLLEAEVERGVGGVVSLGVCINANPFSVPCIEEEKEKGKERRGEERRGEERRGEERRGEIVDMSPSCSVFHNFQEACTF
jgi:hypothetical protein